MRTNYVGHDDMYKKNKAAGQAGWDPAEISEEVIKQFQELFTHESIPQACRLLELGCGAGNLSVGFARLGYQVTGVDIAPSAIEWGKGESY
ncbi:MAG: methyltransferase domain-containing protein [Planctomycetota bacterium]|nr:methyltransferase domain-containing protein [Planctomycetota bacterium]